MGRSARFTVSRINLGVRLKQKFPERSGNLMQMRVVISLLAGVCLLLSVAAMARAEDQKKTATKEGRLSGTVHMIDKDTSTIIIRKGADRRTVVYTAETKITIQNKPGSLDDVIVGRRATCVGTQKEKTQFLATRVDVRTK
jgi:hypothetical protein